MHADNNCEAITKLVSLPYTTEEDNFQLPVKILIDITHIHMNNLIPTMLLLGV